MESENGNSILIDSILDEALACLRNGGAFDVEGYCQRYPELAEDLRVMLPALSMLEKPNSESSDRIPESTFASGQLQSQLTDFQIVSEIGRGAMGVVYEAIQKPLGRRVALKVLMRAGKSNHAQPLRFRREAEIAARLHHTNIVPVFEAGESEGCVYYAMQLIEGANLQQWIASGENSQRGLSDNGAMPVDDTVFMFGSTEKDQQPVVDQNQGKSLSFGSASSPRQCARIAMQIAEGLEFAHERGILHRDIKPSNIMLDRDGQAWITDFGLAKANEGIDLTATGDVVGTIRYLAPERFRGQSDHRSDIYSLGLTLYELVERQPAWPALDRAQLIQKIVGGDGFQIQSGASHWSGDLRRIVEKSTAGDPDQRYQRAGEMAEDLRRFLDGRPVLAQKQSIVRSFLFWTRRNPVTASLVATIAVLLVGGLIAVSTLLVRERNQSRIADENFQTALEAVRTYFTTVSDSTELKSSGAEHLRRELLTAAQSYYESFSRNHRNNPRLRSELADAEFLLGRIHEQMGDLPSAVACFERARELVVKSEPGDQEYLMELLHNLADANRQLGKYEAAESNFIEARELARQLVEQSPGKPDFKLDLANLECWLGMVYGSMSRPVEEARCYDHASEILTGDLPRLNDKQAESLQAIHKNLGMYCRKQGKLEEARAHYGKVIELGRQSKIRHPDSAEHGSRLAQGYVNLGELELVEGRWAQARQALTQASEILNELIVRHPLVVSYREGLGTCQVNLGQIELRAGNFHDAEKVWLLALQTYERLAEDNPQGTEPRFAMAQTICNLGVACFHQGRKEDGIMYFQKAFAQMKLLVEQNPDNAEFAEVHSGVGSNLASMLGESGRTKEAMDTHLESIRTHEKLMAMRPGVLSMGGTLANSYINASSASKGMGNQASALNYARKAIKLIERLEEEKGSAVDYRNALAAAYNLAGLSQYETGQTEPAEADFLASIRLYEALITEQPDNTTFRKMIGTVRHNLAMNFREAGKSEDALKQSDLSIRNFEEAEQMKSGSAGDFSYVRLERAKTVGRLGRYAEAIAECQKICDTESAADRDCAGAITAHLLAANGNWEEGLEKARSLDDVRFSDPRDAIELAAAWAWLGKAVADGLLSVDSLPEDLPPTAEGCFGRAMALIEEAIGQGLKNKALFESLESLEPLRSREDYQRVLKTIQPKAD